MTLFDNAIYYLDSLGLTDIILPFVLIFTVIFALLQRVMIFKVDSGEKDGQGKPVMVGNRKINVIIALAMALITVIPHVTHNYQMDNDPITIINNFLPGAIVLTVVILIFLMLVGFLGGDKSAAKSPLVGIAAIIAIIGLIAVLWRALYPTTTPQWLSFFDDPQIQGLVIVILIMGIVIWAVTGEGGGKSEWQTRLKEFFGGS
jgi:amino acid transporter